MKFFSTNSPLYQFLCRLWDIIQVNFFWLLGCIPVVTIGASTAAAFKVCLHLAMEQEGYIYKEYWAGFKENWKQGTVLEAIFFFAPMSFIWICSCLRRLREIRYGFWW